MQIQLSFNSADAVEVAQAGAMVALFAPKVAPVSDVAQPLVSVFGNQRPLPAWAPAGSTWVSMPGAPALQGPDGHPIAVDWSRGLPMQGTIPPANHDSAAEAAGAALLASINGAQP